MADAFLRNFTEHADVGAACCVHVGGEPVVDVWAGDADRDAGRAWARDTIVIVFSCTKGVTAVAANQLIERGDLDPDAPVAQYWPEFAANGKERIPVEWVLSHRAGLAALDVPDLTLDDIVAWDPVIDAIAAQAPNWEPGTAHGYHVRTYGWMVGELIRRITGKMPGEYVAAEIAGPLGLDFMIGVPEHEDRARRPGVPGGARRPGGGAARRGGAQRRVDVVRTRHERAVEAVRLRRPVERTAAARRADAVVERPRRRAVALAHVRARASARSTVCGCWRRRPSSGRRSRGPTGTDCVIGQPLHFGLGFALPPTLGLDPGPRSFGHPGAGGSLAYADPDRELAFSYVMNQMRFSVTEPDPRAQGLVAATYAVLDRA